MRQRAFDIFLFINYIARVILPCLVEFVGIVPFSIEKIPFPIGLVIFPTAIVSFPTGIVIFHVGFVSFLIGKMTFLTGFVPFPISQQIRELRAECSAKKSHDNRFISSPESMFILNCIANTISYIEAISPETQLKPESDIQYPF